LTEGERGPIWRTKHKDHIEKVMFLSAVACPPRYDENRVWLFDGKIDTCPFIQHTPELRNSINRPTGTMIATYLPVTKQMYEDMGTKKVNRQIRRSGQLV
jgi:hypothetical protein